MSAPPITMSTTVAELTATAYRNGGLVSFFTEGELPGSVPLRIALVVGLNRASESIEAQLGPLLRGEVVFERPELTKEGQSTRDERIKELVNEAIDCFATGFPGSGFQELRKLKAMLEPIDPEATSNEERTWRPEGGIA